MTVLYVVFPVALLLSAFAVVAFLWAVRRGQFDDLTTPALRVLTDDCQEKGARELWAKQAPGSGLRVGTSAPEKN
jgi:cbb3-type cytochrome oxidase maturation protein